MISINTTAAQGYPSLLDNTLAASVTFAFVDSTNVLTITDATTYGAGDARKCVNITLADKFGKQKDYRIGTTPANVAINVATEGFNKSEGIDALVTVVSNLDKRKDGSITNISIIKASGSFIIEK